MRRLPSANKLEMIQYGAKLANEVFQWVHEKLLTMNHISLDELAGYFSDSCDYEIFQAHNEGLKFVAGKLIIQLSAMGTAHIEVMSETFYQNSKEQWVKKTNQSKPLTIDVLNEKSRQELLSLKKVEYEIHQPNDYSKFERK